MCISRNLRKSQCHDTVGKCAFGPLCLLSRCPTSCRLSAGIGPAKGFTNSIVSCGPVQTPRTPRSRTMSTRCGNDRPRRSSFQTTSVSPGRHSVSAASNPGLSTVAPLTVSVNRRSHPAVRSASVWRSRFCSAVDTLAYPISMDVAPFHVCGSDALCYTSTVPGQRDRRL
jgi:hypothetical protein